MLYNDLISSFSNQKLTSAGNVLYNVTCTSLGIVNETGYVYVSDMLFFDFYNQDLFTIPEYAESSNYRIVSINSFLSPELLNNSFKFYSLTLKNFSTISNTNMFYYSGNINSEEKEIIN